MNLNLLQILKVAVGIIVIALVAYFVGSCDNKKKSDEAAKAKQEAAQLKQKNDSIQMLVVASQLQVKILQDTQITVLKHAASLSAKIAVKDKQNDSLLKVIETKEAAQPASDSCKSQVEEVITLAESYKTSRDSLKVVVGDLRFALKSDTAIIKEKDKQLSDKDDQLKNVNKNLKDAITDLDKEQHQKFLGIPLPDRKTSFAVGVGTGIIASLAAFVHIK